MTITLTTNRCFTPELANKTLPLVRAIVSDVCELRQSVRERQERVEALLADHQCEQASPYHDELAAMRRSLDQDQRQIRSYLRELATIGVMYITEGTRSAVHFPATVGGRTVYLSWSTTESEVQGWREHDEPLTVCHDLSEVKFSDTPTPYATTT